MKKLDQAATRGSAGTFSDSSLMDYIVCPAKSFINMYSEKKSPRQIARDRFRPMLAEIALGMMSEEITIDEDKVAEVVAKAFTDIEYWKKYIDVKAVTSMFTNFVNMIHRDEFTVSGLAKKFTSVYEGTPINSQIDLMITDRKGRINPTIVDYSNTKYDNVYNPVLFRCQLVCDYLQTVGTNTPIRVLTICAGKQWQYDQNRYAALMKASIEEYLTMMDNDWYPLRVGWWCAGCFYRGLCHRLLTTK